MEDCIFCKIASGDIPANIIFQDDDFAIFEDINPKAPVHFLGIPKKHISSVKELEAEDTKLIGDLMHRMRKVAEDYPELSKGFRIVSNSGKESGQTVFHIHFHLLGGRRMAWPPG
ncbi:histidine triad nucleotide-binding protein [candidate division KSB1 bacterium]